MDLRNFTTELSNLIIDNDIMKLQLQAIEEQILEIRKCAEKQEEFSEIHLTLLGIVGCLEDIIKKGKKSINSRFYSVYERRK